MSETFLKFLVAELETLRITCKKCRSKATIELPVCKIDRLYAEWECPICKESFTKSDVELEAKGRNYLVDLARAIAGIKEASDRVEIAFIISKDQKAAQTTPG